jgi:nicotinamidase/pyrazinamidase
MNGTHLLVIDPQNDFCDLPEDLLPAAADGTRIAPSLPVTGAHRDMVRLAEWLGQNLAKVNAVTVTLDHHHRLDIAHPGFWRTRTNDVVAPFTQITAAAFAAGDFTVAQGLDAERAHRYLEALEATGRFVHMVWPVHCQIGTWGQCIHAALQTALDTWEDRTARRVRHVLKGENPWTEHYSALQAEIPDPADAATGLNRAMLAELAQADRVLIAGEAGSHCVRATVEHLVENWPHAMDRLVIVEDAISPVAGFEAVYADFLARMRERGLRIATLATLGA